LAQDLFGAAVGVDVRRVEGRDADVERGLHAGVGLLVIDLGPVRDPVAVDELGDLEAGTAQMTISDHASTITPLDGRLETFRRARLRARPRPPIGPWSRLWLRRGTRRA